MPSACGINGLLKPKEAEMATALTEIFGRLLGIGADGQLVSNDIDITPPCADCTITVGAETTNVIPITIQLLKADGSDMDAVTQVKITVYADAAGAAIDDGGSTGLAAGTDGAELIEYVAKKEFKFSSEADGDIDLTFTDTGTTAYYLGVELPTGRVVFSDVVQMA